MSQPVFGKHSENYDRMTYKEKILEATGGVDLIAVYVDDEASLLEIVGEHLADFGFQVATFTSPNDALKYIVKNKNRIGLILSDYMMPDMNGFEFREDVLRVAPELPFAVLSGNITKEMALKGMELKISTFIHKPSESKKIFELVEREVNPRIAAIFEEMDLLKGFIDDSVNLLENAEEIFLNISESGANADSINQVFGMIHTIKGSSGFFEPRTLHKFAHRFEDTLKEVQAGERVVDVDLVSIWLTATDILKELVAEFKSQSFAERNVEQMVKMFDLKEGTAGLPTSGGGTALAAAANRDVGHGIKKQEEIKVAMTMLDEFMQLSGEMTVIRNMINKVVRTIEKQYPSDKDVLLLSDMLDELHKVNGMVQTKMTDIRKVPIRNVVKPLNRIIRDVAKSLDKEVDFSVEGEDLRIDNSLATVLSNSLIHLVRNSLDHGLETKEQRAKTKKPAAGKVKISCVQSADEIVVSIIDDGRGINPEVIAKKCIEKGLKTEAELKQMSKSEIMGMIFASGFSTAAAVTDISGRGVGMSMVKDSVEAVGGKIRIESEVGEGSVFKLELPLPKSVLITNCLFVVVGSHQFGIPQDQIQRIILVNDDNRERLVSEIEGTRLLKLEGHLVPIIRLSDVVQIPGKRVEEQEYSLCVLEAGESKFVLQVDEVLDVEDTVIKQLTSQAVKQSNLFLGATFLGDGSVGLIFDVEGMAKAIGIDTKKTFTKAEDEAGFHKDSEGEDRAQWLVVETGDAGKFLLPQDDVFRIEEFKKSDCQRAADLWVVPYRGSVLSLVDLHEVLFGKEYFNIHFAGEAESNQIVVVETAGKFIGLRVTQISDLIETNSKVEPLLNHDPVMEGGIIYNNETLTVINLHKLLNKLNQHMADSGEEVSKINEAAA